MGRGRNVVFFAGAIALLLAGCSSEEFHAATGGTGGKAGKGGSGGASGGTGGASGGTGGATGGTGGATGGTGGAKGGAGGSGGATGGSGGATGGSAGLAGSTGTGGVSSCGASAVCVQAAPSGWTGPVAVYQGSPASLPACAGSLTEAETAFANANWPNPACSACTCAAATGEHCDAHVAFGDSTCSGPTIDTIGALCGLKSVGQSLSLTHASATPVISAGTCASGAPAVPLPATPTSGTAMRACDGIALSGATCDGKCVSAPTQPFDGICIYATGDMPCPTGEYSQKTVYQTYTDQRSCTACSCGSPSGGSCSVVVKVYYGTPTCSSSAGTLSSGNGCATLSPPISTPDTVSARLQSATVTQAGTCQPGGGQGQGQFLSSGDLTVCCRQ